MPVHIQNGNSKWDPLFLKASDQSLIFILRIFIISAPPVSQCIAWQKWCVSTQLEKIPDALHIIMPIPEHIKILFFYLT